MYTNTRTKFPLLPHCRRLDMSDEGPAEGEEGEMERGKEMEGGSAQLSIEEEYNLDNYSTSDSEGEGS